MTRIDLNCDLGEALPGTPRWEESLAPGAGADPLDLELLDVVSSANIACGVHAGNPSTMAATCAAARDRGVAIGAHPSYQDAVGMGRRMVEISRAELAEQVFGQLLALHSVACQVGARVRYVKPHGALYNRIVHDATQAAAVVDAVLRLAREVGEEPLPLLGLPGAEVLRMASSVGIPTIAEAFADRGYRGDGSLVPRGEPGAVIVNPEAVAQRVTALATGGEIGTADGTRIALDVQTICLHGDTPGAAALARRIHSTLADARVQVAPVVAVPAPKSYE